MIRIGCFPYLNVWPIVSEFPWEVEWLKLPPRPLVQYLWGHELDMAIVPVVEVAGLEEHYKPIARLGLAVEGPVWSVLLVSRRPMEELEGASIWTTTESATSVRLLDVLLRLRHHVQHWRWHDSPTDADAWLVIGDAALAIANVRGVLSTVGDLSDRFQRYANLASQVTSHRWPFIYDLAKEWTEWQSLPFVFAQWIVAKDWPLSLRQMWTVRLSEHIQRRMDTLYFHEDNCGLSEIEAKYLQRFRFHLDTRDRAGQSRFLAMCDYGREMTFSGRSPTPLFQRKTKAQPDLVIAGLGLSDDSRNQSQVSRP
jgi:predicted solute-binding protein